MGYAPAYRPLAPRASGVAINHTLLGSLLAGAGLIGLGSTLLPLISLTLDTEVLIDTMSSEFSNSDIDLDIIRSSSASVDFGFYDLFSANLLIAAAIPLALILALFAGGALLAGYSAKNLVAVSGVASVFALLLLIFTTIRPMNTFSSSIDELVVDSSDDLPAVWSFGVGLYLSAAMAAVAAAIAIWSHLRAR